MLATLHCAHFRTMCRINFGCLDMNTFPGYGFRYGYLPSDMEPHEKQKLKHHEDHFPAKKLPLLATLLL